MPRVARAFLVWLLVLVLPLQALAASAMRCCGPSAPTGSAVLTTAAGAVHTVAAVDRPTTAAEADPHAHCAGRGAASTEVLGTSAALDDAEITRLVDAAVSADAADGTNGRCSSCAACCLVQALPMAGRLSAAPLPHLVPAQPTAAALAVAPADGLERPPRAA